MKIIFSAKLALGGLLQKYKELPVAFKRLLLVAIVFDAISIVATARVTNVTIVYKDDPVLANAVFLLVGVLFQTVFAFLIFLVIRSRDSTFLGLKLSQFGKFVDMHAKAILSSIFMTAALFILLPAYVKYGPQNVSPISIALPLLFMAGIDWVLLDKLKLNRWFLVAMVALAVGSYLVGLKTFALNLDLSFVATMMGFGLLMAARIETDASALRQKEVESRQYAITRMFWLGLVGSLGAILYASEKGQLALFWNILVTAVSTRPVEFFVAITVVQFFGAIVNILSAKAYGDPEYAALQVTAALSAKVFLAFWFTFFVGKLIYLGQVSNDWRLLVVSLVAALTLLFGSLVLQFAKNDDKDSV